MVIYSDYAVFLGYNMRFRTLLTKYARIQNSAMQYEKSVKSAKGH